MDHSTQAGSFFQPTFLSPNLESGTLFSVLQPQQEREQAPSPSPTTRSSFSARTPIPSTPPVPWAIKISIPKGMSQAECISCSTFMTLPYHIHLEFAQFYKLPDADILSSQEICDALITENQWIPPLEHHVRIPAPDGKSIVVSNDVMDLVTWRLEQEEEKERHVKATLPDPNGVSSLVRGPPAPIPSSPKLSPGSGDGKPLELVPEHWLNSLVEELEARHRFLKAAIQGAQAQAREAKEDVDNTITMIKHEIQLQKEAAHEIAKIAGEKLLHRIEDDISYGFETGEIPVRFPGEDDDEFDFGPPQNPQPAKPLDPIEAHWREAADLKMVNVRTLRGKNLEAYRRERIRRDNEQRRRNPIRKSDTLLLPTPRKKIHVIGKLPPDYKIPEPPVSFILQKGGKEIDQKDYMLAQKQRYDLRHDTLKRWTSSHIRAYPAREELETQTHDQRPFGSHEREPLSFQVSNERAAPPPAHIRPVSANIHSVAQAPSHIQSSNGPGISHASTSAGGIPPPIRACNGPEIPRVGTIPPPPSSPRTQFHFPASQHDDLTEEEEEAYDSDGDPSGSRRVQFAQVLCSYRFYTKRSWETYESDSEEVENNPGHEGDVVAADNIPDSSHRSAKRPKLNTDVQAAPRRLSRAASFGPAPTIDFNRQGSGWTSATHWRHPSLAKDWPSSTPENRNQQGNKSGIWDQVEDLETDSDSASGGSTSGTSGTSSLDDRPPDSNARSSSWSRCVVS